MPIRSARFGNERRKPRLGTRNPPRERVAEMSVTANDLMEVDKVLSTSNSDAQVVTELRRRFPHLSWTQCDASDVIEAPFRSYARFDLHLLDSADHCSQ